MVCILLGSYLTLSVSAAEEDVALFEPIVEATESVALPETVVLTDQGVQNGINLKPVLTADNPLRELSASHTATLQAIGQDPTLSDEAVRLDSTAEAASALQRISLSPSFESDGKEGKVRKGVLAADLDYNLSKGSSLGVGVSTEIYDKEDARAWNKTVDTEEIAQIKYKKKF